MKIKNILKEKSQRKWCVFMVGLFFLASSLSSALQAGSYFADKIQNKIRLSEGIPINKEIQELLTIYVDGVTIQNMFFFMYTDNYTQRLLYTSANKSELTPKNVFEDAVYELAYKFHEQDICYVKKSLNLSPSSGLTPIIEDFLNNDPDLINNSFYISCPVFTNGTLLGYVSAVTVKSTNGVVADVNLMHYVSRKVSSLLDQRIES